MMAVHRRLPFKKLESSRVPLVDVTRVTVGVAVWSSVVGVSVVLTIVVDSDSSLSAPDVEATASSVVVIPVGSESDSELIVVVDLGESSSSSWRRPIRPSRATASWKARSRHSKARGLVVRGNMVATGDPPSAEEWQRIS